MLFPQVSFAEPTAAEFPIIPAADDNQKFALLNLNKGRLHFNSFVDGQAEFDIILESPSTRLLDVQQNDSEQNLFTQIVSARSTTLPAGSNESSIFLINSFLTFLIINNNYIL